MNNFKKNIYKTSTDVVAPISRYWRFSIGAASSGTACGAVSYPVVYYTSTSITTLVNGVQLYNDSGLTIPGTGGGDLIYKSQEQNQAIQIAPSGIITVLISC